MGKRYTITADFQIIADNDVDAKIKAAQCIERMRAKEDNQASILTIHETPFASFATRLVHKGDLNLINNKTA